MNWLEANGTSLRYDLSGAGPTTLVLIHEMGGTLESWDQVMPAIGNTRLGSELEVLLGLADRALYIAKNSGRDRVHALIGNEARRLGPAIERLVEQFGPPSRDARPARSVVGQ